MATSVICQPLVRERSASPITRLAQYYTNYEELAAGYFEMFRAVFLRE
jgi:hypothetical protein